MNITKEHFEKLLKTHDTITVYSPDNIPLSIRKSPYIRRMDTHIEFDIDCADLADYCNLVGLSLKPDNN